MSVSSSDWRYLSVFIVNAQKCHDILVLSDACKVWQNNIISNFKYIYHKKVREKQTRDLIPMMLVDLIPMAKSIKCENRRKWQIMDEGLSPFFSIGFIQFSHRSSLSYSSDNPNYFLMHLIWTTSNLQKHTSEQDKLGPSSTITSISSICWIILLFSGQSLYRRCKVTKDYGPRNPKQKYNKR